MGAETSKRHGRPATVIPLRRALLRRLATSTSGTDDERTVHALRVLGEIAKARAEAISRTSVFEAFEVLAAIHNGRCWCSRGLRNTPPGHLQGCDRPRAHDEEGRRDR